MSVHDHPLIVTPRLITFETEEQLHDHAEKLNQIGVSPDVPIMDSRGIAVLASRTAPGGDGWGFAYYSPGEDGFMECIHTDCTDCGGPRRAFPGQPDWSPTFPVTGLVCYDLTGVEGLS